jgi:hypothetical protein
MNDIGHSPDPHQMVSRHRANRLRRGYGEPNW